jgi:hypothetical protein
MTLKFDLRRNGKTELGYYGFSWTLLFFGPFVAWFRRDFSNGIVLLFVELTFLYVVLLCFNSLWLPVVGTWFAITLAWAGIYNELFTLIRLKSGSTFSDSVAAQAIQSKYSPSDISVRISSLYVRAVGTMVLFILFIQVLTLFIQIGDSSE